MLEIEHQALVDLDKLCNQFNLNWNVGIENAEQWEFFPTHPDRCITILSGSVPIGVFEINSGYSGGIIGYAGIHHNINIWQVEYMLLVAKHGGHFNV